MPDAPEEFIGEVAAEGVVFVGTDGEQPLAYVAIAQSGGNGGPLIYGIEVGVEDDVPVFEGEQLFCRQVGEAACSHLGELRKISRRYQCCFLTLCYGDGVVVASEQVLAEQALLQPEILLLSMHPPRMVVGLPAGAFTITVTGGSAYQWQQDGDNGFRTSRIMPNIAARQRQH